MSEKLKLEVRIFADVPADEFERAEAIHKVNEAHRLFIQALGEAGIPADSVTSRVVRPSPAKSAARKGVVTRQAAE